MTTTLARRQAPLKYAPGACVPTDPKVGPIAQRLAELRWADTPGAAHQRMLRVRADLELIVGTAIANGCDAELDRYLQPIDETRTAGSVIVLDGPALNAIEKCDSEENIARERWENDRSTDNARLVINAALRQVRASLELVRGVRSAHPELAR